MPRNMLSFAGELDQEMLNWIRIVIYNYHNRKTWHSLPSGEEDKMALFKDLGEVKKALAHSIEMYPNDLDQKLYKIIYKKDYRRPK